jgi:hypothetical protein
LMTLTPHPSSIGSAALALKRLSVDLHLRTILIFKCPSPLSVKEEKDGLARLL